MIVNPKQTSSVTNKVLKSAAIATSAVIPAVYIAKMHIDMFKKDDTQNRDKMRNKMIGLLSGMGLSVILVHKKINNNFYQFAKFIVAAASPFVGLELSKKVNEKLYPDSKMKNQNTPNHK